MILVKLLERIGLVQRREREAGSWVIEDEAIAAGEGWQDWLASHRVVHAGPGPDPVPGLPRPGPQQRSGPGQESRSTSSGSCPGSHHDGLLRPRDLVESELGVGLVYPYDPQWQRLDLWLAGQQGGVPLATQLSMIRQVGEAVAVRAQPPGRAPRALPAGRVGARHGEAG